MDKSIIAKLPKLDCIAAKIYEQINAANEAFGALDELKMVEILDSMQHEVIGKLERNESSYIVFFTDNSCLRIDMSEEDGECFMDMYVGQYTPGKNKNLPMKEILTNTPLIPATNTKH